MIYFRVITSNEDASPLIGKVENLIACFFGRNFKSASKPYWKCEDFVEIEFEIRPMLAQPFCKYQDFFEKSLDEKPDGVSQEYGWTEIEYYGKITLGEKYFATLSIEDKHIM